ncbi:hypothetical protein Hanom_Chr12g01099111 [Helianthus anomalus]
MTCWIEKKTNMLQKIILVQHSSVSAPDLEHSTASISIHQIVILLLLLLVKIGF